MCEGRGGGGYVGGARLEPGWKRGGVGRDGIDIHLLLVGWGFRK